MATQQLRAGQLLHEGRNRLNLTLKEISDILHIPVRQLEALERDDISPFAAEVYAQGAARKYASFLGLDIQQVERALMRANKDTRTPIALSVYTPARWFERWQHPSVVIAGVVILLACIVGGYFLWQLRSFWQLPDVQVISPERDVIVGNTVHVEGIAEPETKIQVNNEPVLLHADNHFSVEMGLQPGVNIVRVTAENAAGRIRVIERHILRPHEGSSLTGDG